MPTAPFAPRPSGWRRSSPGLAWAAAAGVIGPRGQAGLGALCFIAVCAAFSTDLRAVSWRTVGWGIALQLGLALFILKLEIGGVTPGLRVLQRGGRHGASASSSSPTRVAVFVFGALANPAVLEKVLGAGNGFVFAFTALPTIIFISSFFTILYYFGVLQFIVRLMARGDDVRDADERRRNAVGGGQRLHGPDRGADHRQAVRAAR